MSAGVHTAESSLNGVICVEFYGSPTMKDFEAGAG